MAERRQSDSLAVKNLGLDAARDAATKKVHDIEFDPSGNTDLDEPKEGEHDVNNQPHQGGNRWAGGVSIISLLWGHARYKSIILAVGRPRHGWSRWSRWL